jgi:tetratricopeptide (TPR) repeat protein
MPRFDRLELDPAGEEPQSLERAPERQHDESHWLRSADENRRTGNYENALRFYSRALEVDKSLLAGWLGQVQMLIQLEEYPEADLWSRKALELFRNNGDLLAAQAQAVCRKGDQKQAAILCDGAIRAEGLSAYRWMVRGEIMLTGRDRVDQHCFDKAIQIDSDWLVPLEIALIYMHHQVLSKAQVRARQAVEKAPDSYYSWYTLGVCEMELGFTAKARHSFHRCLELAPKHTEAQQRLAELDSRLGTIGRSLRRLFGKS